MKKVLVGIDPGTKTGFAVSINEKLATVKTLRIDEALKEMLILKDFWAGRGFIKVYIEDARQRKWFGKSSDAKLQGAGSIKRDCVIWEDFLKANNFDYVLVSPHSQKGLTKVKQANFINMTKWTGRTSEHSRDAALLIFGR